MNMDIYINRQGQQLGPFDEATVRQMLASGALSAQDLGVKKGDPSWRALGELFPTYQAPPQFQAPQLQAPPLTPPGKAPVAGGGSKALKYGLFGCAGLFLLGIIGAAAIFALMSLGKKTDSASGSSNSSSGEKKVDKPTAMKEAPALISKAGELMKMAPPQKINPAPYIKGKIAIVKQDKDSSEADLIGFSYDGKFFEAELSSSYQFSQNRFATTVEEIDTLLQLSCQKGGALGTYTGGTVAYANICNVTVIDYKTPAIIAKQTFTNKTPPLKQNLTPGAKEYVLLPADGFRDYINNLPLEKLKEPLIELPFDKSGGNYGDYTGLTDLAPELFRVNAPENLSANPTVKGKFAVVENDSVGSIKLGGIDGFGKDLSKYDYDNWGLPQNRQAKTIDELETLIKINCQAGSKLGSVARVTVFSNKCDVSLIDYKTFQTVAKKTFENKEMTKDIDLEVYDSRYVVLRLDTDINNYIKSFPK